MATAKSIEELLKDPSVLKKGTTPVTPATDEDEEKKPTAQLEKKMDTMRLMDLERKAAGEAAALGVPYIDLIGFPISPETLTYVPVAKAKELKVLVFLAIGEELRIGAVHPDDEAVKELAYQLGEEHHANTAIYKISDHSFDEVVKMYDKIPVYVKPVEGVSITEEELEKYKDVGIDFTKLQAAIEKTTVTDMVALIIAAALQARSSDIHIEAEELDVKVRFRIDGVLRTAASIRKELWEKIVSRIKLYAKLKLNINDKPQDGRFSIITKTDKIDVRVSCIPTAYGESIVMRLLQGSSQQLRFEDLGVIGIAAKRLQEQINRPNGMIITTGPTGSGKTTTLYTVLTKLNEEGTKIITLEDPIEYRLTGINQSQIDKSKNYSFADGLRSILRQDPDIVMVGELRDLETCDIAINAALTGHLVLSTIHANSASGAIPRFLAMGVRGFLLAPAINAIMGQRLVRKICTACQEPYTPTPDEMERVEKILAAIPDDHPDKPKDLKIEFKHGKGCPVCNGTGYKGRIGIYEIMIMSPDIEKAILSGIASEYDMQQLAVKNHMLTMIQDGVLKALQGITSIDEVFRVSEE